MHIYTSSFFKFRNKANFYSFLGASAGTGAPRNTQKIGTQCGSEYGYKNYESFGSLKNSLNLFKQGEGIRKSINNFISNSPKFFNGFFYGNFDMISSKLSVKLPRKRKTVKKNEAPTYSTTID